MALSQFNPRKFRIRQFNTVKKNLLPTLYILNLSIKNIKK